MRPAVIAFALALFLFLLVQGIRPPVLYFVLIIPVAILVSGFIAKDFPEEEYGDEENDEVTDEGSGTGFPGNDEPATK